VLTLRRAFGGKAKEAQMPRAKATQDLSKVKEVKCLAGPCEKMVNDLLATGKWILLDAKIVQWSRWQPESGVYKAHCGSGSDSTFVLGRVK
jgi:hypothetical protein